MNIIVVIITIMMVMAMMIQVLIITVMITRGRYLLSESPNLSSEDQLYQILHNTKYAADDHQSQREQVNDHNRAKISKTSGIDAVFAKKITSKLDFIELVHLGVILQVHLTCPQC